MTVSITHVSWTATLVRDGLGPEERELLSLSGSVTPFSRNQSRAASPLRNFLCLDAEKFRTCSWQSSLDKQKGQCYCSSHEYIRCGCELIA